MMSTLSFSTSFFAFSSASCGVASDASSITTIFLPPAVLLISLSAKLRPLVISGAGPANGPMVALMNPILIVPAAWLEGAVTKPAASTPATTPTMAVRLIRCAFMYLPCSVCSRRISSTVVSELPDASSEQICLRQKTET